MVFSGPPTGAGDTGPGAEYARLDYRMNRRDASIYPLDAWPAEPRPSLYLARRITIPTSPESVQFYGTARRDLRYNYYWYWH